LDSAYVIRRSIAFDKTINQLDMVKERIRELEDRSAETPQTKR
jgi:hypothetical protein